MLHDHFSGHLSLTWASNWHLWHLWLHLLRSVRTLSQYLPTYGCTWSYRLKICLFVYICPMLIGSYGVMNGLTPGSWHPVSFSSARQNQPAGSTARWLSHSCNWLHCQVELLKDNWFRLFLSPGQRPRHWPVRWLGLQLQLNRRGFLLFEISSTIFDQIFNKFPILQNVCSNYSYCTFAF